MKPRTSALPAILCLALLAAPGVRADDAAIVPKLVPMPAHMVREAGGFTVTADTPVRAADGPVLRQVGRQFTAMLDGRLPLTLDLAKDGSRRDNIAFAFDATRQWPSPDAYSIDIDGNGVRVSAGDAKGLYYGAVTLAQLLTSGDADVETAGVRLPALHIDDAPRFGWRGVMLDSARHFQSVEDIQRLLDAMAQLKLDVFHWHLTDDQGWRFPVPGWSKLTTVGACRIPAGDGGIDAATGEPAPYCGFYTEAQIREVVAYAAERHIDVVPEVDIPGHATAAIAAYPQLGVLDTPLATGNEWGVYPNLFNADESTMRFLESVLDQLARLFPGRYVHIGGDEAVKDQWQASKKMQARIRELGAKDEAGLQAWMVARLERRLERHGKRLLGWDEILDGDLPPTATVMSWNGIEGGVKAAGRGHDVVMTPVQTHYLDYLQTASPDEPPGRPTLVTLRKIYDFEPVPAALDAGQARHILGVQANVWTEHMRGFDRVQHAIFPRIAALAESAWSPQAARDYAGFLQRLPSMLPRWRAQGIAWARTPFQPLFEVQGPDAGGNVRVTLSQPLDYPIRYTTDGSTPTASSPLYAAPLTLPLPATLQAGAFFDGHALAAPLARELTAASLRSRSDEQLAMCTDQLMLRLEDDGPRLGDRAIYNVDIFNPCWSWKQAPLAGIDAIEVRAGHMPYLFQLAHDESHRGFKPAKTPNGELELHAGCDGPLLASLPMPASTDPDGFVTLRAPLHDAPASTDLCIWFTGDTRPAMWVLDRVTLVPGGGD